MLQLFFWKNRDFHELLVSTCSLRNFLCFGNYSEFCVCVLGGGRDWYSVYLLYMTCVYVCVHKCVHVCLVALATEKWEWETQGILLF